MCYMPHISLFVCLPLSFVNSLIFPPYTLPLCQTFLVSCVCLLYFLSCILPPLMHALSTSLSCLLYSFLQILCNSALLFVLSINFERFLAHTHAVPFSCMHFFSFLCSLSVVLLSSFCQALSPFLHMRAFLSPVHILFCFYLLLFWAFLCLSRATFVLYLMSCLLSYLLPLFCVLLSCLPSVNLCLCLPFPSYSSFHLACFLTFAFLPLCLTDFIPFSLFSVCSFFSPSSTLSFFALLLFMFLWISVSQSNPHAPFQVSEILILTFLLSFASLVVFACSFCHFCSTTPLYLPL